MTVYNNNFYKYDGILMFDEQDQTVFDWIRRGCDELIEARNPNWKGNFISHLVPPVFESYAKVLHNIEAHYELIDNPLSPSENAILEIPTCEPLKSFVERRRTGSHGVRIRWKELAELLNVPFAPAIKDEWYTKKLADRICWARLLHGPEEGFLTPKECQALAAMLKVFTDDQECFFRISDIPLYAFPEQTQLFRGRLEEVSEFQNELKFGIEYWWPLDRRWCVCSEYDMEFTVVGGSRDLISALLRNPILECIEVMPKVRIDYLAPMP